MPLSSTSIRHPVSVVMLYVSITLLGIFALSQLGIDLLPNVNVPHLVVQTTYPNASAEEVEKQITEPLEAAASTVAGVKKVTSVSKEGISVISIDFVWGTNIKFAVLSLREKLDNMSFALPKEAGRPTIIRVDPSSSPIMSLVLAPSNSSNDKFFSNAAYPLSDIEYVDHSSDYSQIKRLIDLKEAARVIFKRRFEQIEGVAQAVVTGGLEREILVQVDPQKLYAFNLTYDDLNNALKSSNLNLPAGSIMKGLFKYSLRTIGEFRTIDDIENTIVRKNNDHTVILLKDVAAITENFKEREGLTRFNGNEAVGILIYKQADANTVSIAREVKKTIASLNKNYPDYKLFVVSDQSGFIEQAISNVKQEIFYGGILAVLVLFFFLGNLRNILIIGITIPSSLVITVLLLYLFDINFNIISLGGIAVGVGMLLDNAIIVIENVVRYKELGFSNRLAAIKGTNEVAMPIVASTLTTIAVFLPLIFVRGIAGELFKDQSYAIAFSLTASIVTALTLIPMLASRDNFQLIKNPSKYSSSYLYIDKPIKASFFKKVSFFIKLPFIIIFRSFVYIFVQLYLFLGKVLTQKLSIFFQIVERFLKATLIYYEKLLEWALNNKKKVLLITAFLLVLTVAAFNEMKKEFIPAGAQDEFIVEIDYPNGTSLKGNALLTSKIEHSILSVPNVDAVISNIGRVNEFDFLNKEQIDVNKTNLIVKINSYEDYYAVKEALRKIFSNLKGIKYSFKDVKTTYSTVINPSDNDIVIKIKNKDLDKAYSKAELIIDRIKKANIDGLKEVRLGIQKATPEYSITIDREKCLAYGLNIDEVANQIVNIAKGNIPVYFSSFDQKIGINVKSTEDNRSNIESILNNYVQSENKKIKIGDLVNYSFGYNYSEIWREEQSRTSLIYASISGVDLDKTIDKINKVISQLPKNNNEIITIGGTNEEIHSAFSALYIALVISVLLMYMVLASEFESFLFPFVILFSIPLGLIGSILLLYIFGESISIISIMGLIILVGIADNDAVVKVEFIIRKREEGLSLHDAIIQAGQDRFRPIVMNTFTVVFGLIPMMIGIGAATQLRVSLSLAVVGGLISSTFLTLIIIPVLYSYFEKYSKKKFLNK
ncbi:efflux RND transporter permease subunit [Melioribacteraceae bacterium 4301-Me]|uniref:efflux RND transporter permease subunit n=1 Tax=Pyranulibacter aquaticus TaxID=3163344 RepID=UPI00359B2700